MTADVQRELAEVTAAHRAEAHRIWNEALCNAGIPGWDRDAELARAIADAEKRAAARALREAADDVDDGEFSDRWSHSARLAILRRADALDPSHD